jgi:predicted DNA-binding transcriptional regulator AlpA
MDSQPDFSDLTDARGVAELLGLSRRSSVAVYQARYPEMPRPVVDLGPHRPHLWSREAIIEWAAKTGRPKRSKK